MNEITIYEYLNGGVRIVRGQHVVSNESGVPTAIRSHRNVNQAIAAERGDIRKSLFMMAAQCWTLPSGERLFV